MVTVVHESIHVEGVVSEGVGGVEDAIGFGSGDGNGGDDDVIGDA